MTEKKEKGKGEEKKHAWLRMNHQSEEEVSEKSDAKGGGGDERRQQTAKNGGGKQKKDGKKQHKRDVHFTRSVMVLLPPFYCTLSVARVIGVGVGVGIDGCGGK